jgi:hypothetical protein
MLEGDAAILPDPFRAHTRVFVDWALQRAHEKDRKIMEMGTYYMKKIERERDDVIKRLKNRVGSPMQTPTPWADSLSSWGMY